PESFDEAMHVDARKKWEQAMDEEASGSHGEPDMGFGEATQRQKSITEKMGVQSERRRRQEKIQGLVGGQGVCKEK
ncbi:hypothetical protein KI387_003990, partial [Taxus chinensis]